MDYQMKVWVITVGCLFVALLLRYIEKNWKEMNALHKSLDLTSKEREEYDYDYEDFDDYDNNDGV